MIQVWDLAIRVFHWLLAVTVLIALVSGYTGNDAFFLHQQAGALVFALLVFRVVWGFYGTRYARFRYFLHAIKHLRVNLFSGWKGYGHSPHAVLAVISMLILLAVQALLGLFSEHEDLDIYMPFAQWLSADQVDLVHYLHSQIAGVISLLVILHVLVVLGYQFLLNKNIIQPMITGRQKIIPGYSVADYKKIKLPNLFLSLMLSCLVYSGLQLIFRLN